MGQPHSPREVSNRVERGGIGAAVSWTAWIRQQWFVPDPTLFFKPPHLFVLRHVQAKELTKVQEDSLQSVKPTKA